MLFDGSAHGQLLPQQLDRLNDRSLDRIDMAVSFVMESGLGRIIQPLEDALDRGAHVRILTTDYLAIADTNANFGQHRTRISIGAHSEIRLVDFNPARGSAALEFPGHPVTLAAMFDGRNDRDEHSYRAALADFIEDRGRYPELGDVLEQIAPPTSGRTRARSTSRTSIRRCRRRSAGALRRLPTCSG